MTAIPICRDDPLVAIVHDMYGANLVRVPDARVRPLSVVVHRNGRSFFRGSLLPILDDARPLGVLPEVTHLTDIAGRRSRRLTLDLGLQLLRGFLRGLGLPHAGLEVSLLGAAYLSFAFPSARRHALDAGALGRALAGRRVDRANPAATIFFEQRPFELLLVDSVLTSQQIAVILSGARGRRLNLDLVALRQALAEIGGTLGSSSDSAVELILQSEHELTFAFTCVQVALADDGSIAAIPPDERTRTLSELFPASQQLSHGPGLLVWDG